MLKSFESLKSVLVIFGAKGLDLWSWSGVWRRLPSAIFGLWAACLVFFFNRENKSKKDFQGQEITFWKYFHILGKPSFVEVSIPSTSWCIRPSLCWVSPSWPAPMCRRPMWWGWPKRSSICCCEWENRRGSPSWSMQRRLSVGNSRTHIVDWCRNWSIFGVATDPLPVGDRFLLAQSLRIRNENK